MCMCVYVHVNIYIYNSTSLYLHLHIYAVAWTHFLMCIYDQLHTYTYTSMSKFRPLSSSASSSFVLLLSKTLFSFQVALLAKFSFPRCTLQVHRVTSFVSDSRKENLEGWMSTNSPSKGIQIRTHNHGPLSENVCCRDGFVSWLVG